MLALLRLPCVRPAVLVALVGVACAMLTAPTAQAAIGQLGAMGSSGSGDGQFRQGLFMDLDTGASSSQVLVGDYAQPDAFTETFRIVPFLLGGSPLPTWGLQSQTRPADTFLRVPSDGAVDPVARVLYIVQPDDNGNKDQVSVYDLTTRPATVATSGVSPVKFASASIGVGLMKVTPTVVAVAPNGDVFVGGQERVVQGGPFEPHIQRFSSSGATVGGVIGGPGTGPGQFSGPANTTGDEIAAIAADPRDGSLWTLSNAADNPLTADVDESVWGRVQHFGTDGAYIEGFDGSGAHPFFGDAGDIAVGPDGTIYLDSAQPTEPANPGHGVIGFKKTLGVFEETVRFGERGSGTCQLAGRSALAVAPNGDVFALDRLNQRVVRFGEGGSGCAGSNAAPQISAFTATPSSPNAGDSVTFDVSVTDDLTPPEGLSFEFDFNNDGTFDDSTVGAPTIDHVFASPAKLVTVKVRVTDSGGASSEQTLDLHIASQRPSAVIAGPVTGSTGVPLAFSAAGSSDPDGTIAKYEWDLGTGFQAGSASLSKVFAAPGTYTVRLRVTDDNGDVSSVASSQVVVSDPPTGGGGPPVDTSPPQFALGRFRSTPTTVSVGVTCPAGEQVCKGTVTIQNGTGAARLSVYGSARFTLAGGATKIVAVRLNSAAKRLLRRGRTIRAQASVRMSDASGNEAQRVASVTIRPKRRG